MAGARLGKYFPFATERLRWPKDSTGLYPSSSYSLSNKNVSETFTLSLHPSSTFGQKEKLGKLNIFYLNSKYESCFAITGPGILVWNAASSTCESVKTVPRGKNSFSLKAFEESPHLFLFGKSMAYYNKTMKRWNLSPITDSLKLPWMDLKLTLLRHETGAYPQLVPEYKKPRVGMVKEEVNLRALEVNYMGKSFWVTSRQPITFNTGNKLVTFELGKKKARASVCANT